jgi:hypothetical protein
MGLSVRGALTWSGREFRSKIVPMFTNDDGSPATEHDARNYLFDELSKGHEIIPIGECDNWDWKTGCQGHPVNIDLLEEADQ